MILHRLSKEPIFATNKDSALNMLTSRFVCSLLFNVDNLAEKILKTRNDAGVPWIAPRKIRGCERVYTGNLWPHRWWYTDHTSKSHYKGGIPGGLMLNRSSMLILSLHGIQYCRLLEFLDISFFLTQSLASNENLGVKYVRDCDLVKKSEVQRKKNCLIPPPQDT